MVLEELDQAALAEFLKGCFIGWAAQEIDAPPPRYRAGVRDATTPLELRRQGQRAADLVPGCKSRWGRHQPGLRGPPRGRPYAASRTAPVTSFTERGPIPVGDATSDAAISPRPICSKAMQMGAVPIGSPMQESRCATEPTKNVDPSGVSVL